MGTNLRAVGWYVRRSGIVWFPTRLIEAFNMLLLSLSKLIGVATANNRQISNISTWISLQRDAQLFIPHGGGN